jgi:hypothetical protein
MRHFGASVLAACLFVVFVPGVIATAPSHGKKWTVLLVHAVLFALVSHHAMKHYHQVVESFGNFGTSCPAGWAMDNPDPNQIQTCKPVGNSRGLV